MSFSIKTNSPLSYPSWLKYQSGLAPDTSIQLYNQYLRTWYAENTLESEKGLSQRIKNDYIQLLKDINFLFSSQEEQDLFLSQIDYNNDEEITLAIPYFVQKLKEISKILSFKREAIKNAKIKYNLAGSNNGLEKILYQYILHGFTSRENNITQVPSSALSNFFPQLSSINGNFFIELEELHDSQSYQDSDPSVPVTEYIDVNSVLNDIPFEDLTEHDVLNLISSRYLSRVVDTPLSRLFNQYLSEITTLSASPSLSASAYQTIYNQAVASQKYLSENVYGLTAVQVDTTKPDLILNLPFTAGNNWFYWPSGDRVSTGELPNNLYKPISINNSNFVNSGATGGTDYRDSDLFFTDQSGTIEGAWLQGPRVIPAVGNLSLRLPAAKIREFIFPWVGFYISNEATSFVDFSLDDSEYSVFQRLTINQQNLILNDYYTRNLPASSSDPIYLNNTTLVYGGALAGESSIDADTITVRQNANKGALPVYNDSTVGESQKAFLYKFTNTDIPISIGVNDINWPVENFKQSDNIPLTVLPDTCIPVRLADLNINTAMLGCVAGGDLTNSDVIYRLNRRTAEPLEAAWLGSGSMQILNTDSTISVYNTSAVQCASYIDGYIQGGLSTKMDAGYYSFVWMDEDTPADKVFFYREHAEDCPYYKNGPYNYFTDQDYQNPNPIKKNPKPWGTCLCKSVHYSPIGHEGDDFLKFNSMSDYLFADPQGMGSDFAINTWQDTRGNNILSSPQFSYYKLDGMEGDMGVGFGTGNWQTSTGDPMILKSGRRYTYYRTPLRTTDGSTPYLIVSYPYKRVRACQASGKHDVVLLIDVSGSEFNSIATTLKLVKAFVSCIAQNPNAQIAIIYFDRVSIVETFLTNNLEVLLASLDIVASKVPYNNKTVYQTNISYALSLANIVLTKTYNTGNTNTLPTDLFSACSDLNAAIATAGLRYTILNKPRDDAEKTIILFSDGYETVNVGEALPVATSIKQTGTKIMSVAVGINSYFTSLDEQLASPNYYFNFESYLNTSDGDVDTFGVKLASYFSNQTSFPTWYKAVRGLDGRWTATLEVTDMVLYPGDYLIYNHQATTAFTGPNNTSFDLPSISFAFNAPLNGWDYTSSTFSENYIGPNFGGKPFWAKCYTAPDSDSNNKFFKGAMSYGGQVRFFDDYVPVHQPPLSPIVLNNGNLVQYARNAYTDFTWNQPLTLSVSLSNYQWNQLMFYKGVSNLQDLLRTQNVSDLIAYSSPEPSDIMLQSYYSFNASSYNYYARNPFNYTEDLYLINKCTLVKAITATVLEVSQPYANLDNVHYPTVATVSFPSLAVTEKQTGEYLLPENLGTSYYRGRGYSIKVTTDTLTFLDSISAERMFLDPQKYGSRNRGLTRKDQNTPVKIDDIDNRWMYKPYSYGTSAGTIVDTLNNQKFTPYQSKYEITQKNDYGLSRQNDNFAFWNPLYPGVWSDALNYPLTFRKELLSSSYQGRQDKLLVNKGIMFDWKIDIFGNNYGLFKYPNLSMTLPSISSVCLGISDGTAYGCKSTLITTVTSTKLFSSTSGVFSWTVSQPYITQLIVECWGGGGAGGGATSPGGGVTSTGGGGAGGGYAKSIINNPTYGTLYYLNVGSGGTPTPTTSTMVSGTSGGYGGDTWFSISNTSAGSIALAAGGAGGLNANNNRGLGVVSSTGNIGNFITYIGGKGGDGTDGGGGGGAGAGSLGNGGDAIGSYAGGASSGDYSGAGGNGKFSDSSGSGSPGSVYGGAGGGGRTGSSQNTRTYSGGSGAQGLIRITAIFNIPYPKNDSITYNSPITKAFDFNPIVLLPPARES